MTPTRVEGSKSVFGVVGIPTPHPAFGHLLPVEGRRDAATVCHSLEATKSFQKVPVHKAGKFSLHVFRRDILSRRACPMV
jgi:hypothetical protein